MDGDAGGGQVECLTRARCGVCSAPPDLLRRIGGWLLIDDACERRDRAIDQRGSLAFAVPFLGSEAPLWVSLALGEGLALWRGRPYEDFLYESFAQAEIVPAR